MVDEEGTTSSIDFAERHLCPDGECTGLLGADGICQQCGKTGGQAGEKAGEITGGDRLHETPGWVGDRDEPGSEVDDASSALEIETGADLGTLEGTFEIEGDLNERELCSDGSCVGLIGLDRRCKLCGLPAPDSPYPPGPPGQPG